MRFVPALAAIAAAGLARGMQLHAGHDQAVMLTKGDLAVPGESPLEFCESPSDNWVVTIENVDLIPNPPAPGQALVVNATGTVKERIEEGAYVDVQVKYGYIRLITTRADLCEQVKNVDLECPIEAGTVTVVKSVELPKEIPPGKYVVLADVYTKDDVHITCLTATVAFGKKSALGGWLDL